MGIICLLGWYRVNLTAKIWRGCPSPLSPPVPTVLLSNTYLLTYVPPCRLSCSCSTSYLKIYSFFYRFCNLIIWIQSYIIIFEKMLLSLDRKKNVASIIDNKYHLFCTMSCVTWAIGRVRSLWWSFFLPWKIKLYF